MIAAEGEQKASRALKEASEVIAESSSALQLRYLQVKEQRRDQRKIFYKASFGNPVFLFFKLYVLIFDI